MVDTAGNQLPYIDKVIMTVTENLEVLNLRAIAGEYDFQARHIDIGKLPVFLENRAKGNYKVYLDPADSGCDACIFSARPTMRTPVPNGCRTVIFVLRSPGH
jgi:peptide/nickel transport system substrate-binding protein